MKSKGSNVNAPLLSIITLSSVLFIVFYSYILKYVNDLNVKKCECSENWKRDFIKYFSMAAIGVIVLQIVLSLLELKLKLPYSLKLLLNILRGVYGITFTVFLGVLFFYTRNLLKTKCECSEDKMRTIMHYFSTIVGGLYLFVMLLVLILVIIMSAVAQSSIKK
jgi:hypothetical protein